MDDDENQFVVEDVSNILKETIEATLSGNVYQQDKVNQWSAVVSEQCLSSLSKLKKAFKYVVTCSIMQKTGAGLHTASSCYWDSATDGTCTELTQERLQRIENHRSDCIAETKVNPELIGGANKGDFIDDKNLKCLAKCFYQRAGFVDLDENLLLDVIKEKMSTETRENGLQIIEKCKKQKGADSCQTVYLVNKYYFENIRNNRS